MIHSKKASFTSNLTKRQILENLVFSIHFTSTKNIPQIPNFPCENSRKTGGSIVVLTVLKTLWPTHFPTVFVDSWHKENMSLPYKLHSTDKKASINKVIILSLGSTDLPLVWWLCPSHRLQHPAITTKTQLVSYTTKHPRPERKRTSKAGVLFNSCDFILEGEKTWMSDNLITSLPLPIKMSLIRFLTTLNLSQMSANIRLHFS